MRQSQSSHTWSTSTPSAAAMPRVVSMMARRLSTMEESMNPFHETRRLGYD